MARRFMVAMLMLHGVSRKDERAREALADVLPDGSGVSPPDDLGVFDVRVDASDLEGALHTVWNGVAASGCDDHVVFLEHPDLPEHWRARSRAAPARLST
jgi:hypothetical protein